MSRSGKLPGDFAIDALSLEVERRKKRTGDYRYTYGRLVADTTPAEREAIVEQYRKDHRKRKRGGTRTAFLESQKEVLAEAVRKTEEEMAGE